MIIKTILCNRCGAEINGDPHPPMITKRAWKKSEKCTVSSGYRDTEKIHLCEGCTTNFEEFLKNER